MFVDLDREDLKYEDLVGGFGILVEILYNLEEEFGILGEELNIFLHKRWGRSFVGLEVWII